MAQAKRKDRMFQFFVHQALDSLIRDVKTSMVNRIASHKNLVMWVQMQWRMRDTPSSFVALGYREHVMATNTTTTAPAGDEEAFSDDTQSQSQSRPTSGDLSAIAPVPATEPATATPTAATADPDALERLYLNLDTLTAILEKVNLWYPEPFLFRREVRQVRELSASLESALRP